MKIYAKIFQEIRSCKYKKKKKNIKRRKIKRGNNNPENDLYNGYLFVIIIINFNFCTMPYQNETFRSIKNKKRRKGNRKITREKIDMGKRVDVNKNIFQETVYFDTMVCFLFFVHTHESYFQSK